MVQVMYWGVVQGEGGVRHSWGMLNRWQGEESPASSLYVYRGKHLFSPLKPEEGITAEAFRLLYPQVISDIKVRVRLGFLSLHLHTHTCMCVCTYVHLGVQLHIITSKALVH